MAEKRQVWVNVGCGPHRADSPWINLDVVHRLGEIEPDIVVERHDPLGGFDDGTIDRIYLGHVLEHLPWDRDAEGHDLHTFLETCHAKLDAHGDVLIVGPDVLRTIKGYKRGDAAMPWEIVVAVIEGDDAFQYGGAAWEGARHQWNASAERVILALTAAGFALTREVPMNDTELLDDWPVVSRAEWQSAVHARKFV